MKAHTKQYTHIILLFLLISCFLWNCSDKKEAMKAPIVSKKIAVQKAETPTKSETAFLQTRRLKSVKTVGDQSELEPKNRAGVSRIYDPEKRIDPFSPLFKAEKTRLPMSRILLMLERPKKEKNAQNTAGKNRH
jgi:hypothetical protein